MKSFKAVGFTFFQGNSAEFIGGPAHHWLRVRESDQCTKALIIEQAAGRAAIIARFETPDPLFGVQHCNGLKLRVFSDKIARAIWLKGGGNILSDDYRQEADATKARSLFSGMSDLEWRSLCAALLANQGD